MCIIPYGTQLGEISFCAYNTGAGWRNILEKMKANATVAEWYKSHGRHPVYAKNKDLALPAYDGPLTIVEHDLARREREQHSSDGAPHRRPATRRLPIVS
jgi:hypothetical protein